MSDIGRRATAFLHGVRVFIGIALIVKSVLSVFTPDPWLLSIAGLAVGAAFLVARRGLVPCVVLAAAGPSIVLVHILMFGARDSTRPAEAIVVFGARVYAGGAPSLALEDRMKHGIRLYHDGIAPKLVLSGAPDEIPAMERLALEAGVPAGALELDPAGVNTYATMANLRHRHMVAVSHSYHLARINLVAGRLGIRCATAPCPMTRRLAREPYFVARECAALVAYYLFRG